MLLTYIYLIVSIYLIAYYLYKNYRTVNKKGKKEEYRNISYNLEDSEIYELKEIG